LKKSKRTSTPTSPRPELPRRKGVESSTGLSSASESGPDKGKRKRSRFSIETLNPGES